MSCSTGASAEAILIGDFYFSAKPPHLLIGQTMYFTIASVPHKSLELLTYNDVVYKKRQNGFVIYFFLFFVVFCFFLMKNEINNVRWRALEIQRRKHVSARSVIVGISREPWQDWTTTNVRFGPLVFCTQYTSKHVNS